MKTGKFMANEVYFDHNASTPVDPAVLEAMLPFFARDFGNASSRHEFGNVARKAVNRAREQVAQVWKVVGRMSERQRTVFLLRYVDEQELSEIARATGLNEGTVKAHLSRALAKVRTELRGKR